jgi:DNA-binding MarR family transcriptional regulator
MSTEDRARRELLEELASVGRAHSDATVLFHAALAERVGLNPTDWKAMSVLQARGPLSAGEIAHATGLTTAAVTALIDRLERRRFVRRAGDARDRRRVLVEVTPDAVQTFSVLLESTSRSLARLWRSFSTDELAVIAAFLRRNTERLRVETEKIAAGPVAIALARGST